MHYAWELEQLDKGNRSTELIKRIIEKHEPRAKEMKKMYDRYKANKDGVPIFKRTSDDPMSINNQINNDFFSEIIDIRTGYFAGNEISYIVNKEAEETWNDFKQRNRLADLDSETTKHAGIGGYSARLLYTDEEGEIRVAIVPGWEAILIGDKGIDEPKYAIRYYTLQESENKESLRVELYEGGETLEYRGDNLESLKEYDINETVFDICPMWGYMNNDELQGEAEKVLPLIDGYDNVISDVGSEFEAFRNAYLAFFGVAAPVEEEERAATEQPGTFYFEDGQDAKFITKEIQTDAIESYLDRLHENIYLFTKTPNFRDKKFGNVPSGISLKHMMQPLENKTVAFERKFASGNIRMFEILATAWEKIRVPLKPYEVQQKFTRNFPKDMLYEAQVQEKLKGLVPEEIRLSLFPGIQDVPQAMADLEQQEQSILEQMKREQEQIDEKLKQGDE